MAIGAVPPPPSRLQAIHNPPKQHSVEQAHWTLEKEIQRTKDRKSRSEENVRIQSGQWKPVAVRATVCETLDRIGEAC